MSPVPLTIKLILVYFEIPDIVSQFPYTMFVVAFCTMLYFTNEKSFIF